MSVGNYSIVFRVRVGSIDRSAEASILSGKIVLGDPTGPAAKSSNDDADLLVYEERDQFR